MFDNADFRRPLSAFLPPRIRRIYIHSPYSSFLQNLLGIKAIHADLIGLNGNGRSLGDLAKVRLIYGLELVSQGGTLHEIVSYRSNKGGVDFAVESMYESCVCWGWS